MKMSNIDQALTSVDQDKNVGVKLALLTGDGDMSVFAFELKKNQYIPSHYHKKGIETYFILLGEGIVSLGKVDGKRLVWIYKEKVTSGDSFTIHSNEVHKFENISEQNLRIIATTPLSHIGEDTFFVEENSNYRGQSWNRSSNCFAGR